MKFALIMAPWLLLSPWVMATEMPQDELPMEEGGCARIDQLWQQQGKVGIGPLYLGMPVAEAEQSGQLLYSQAAAGCGAYQARLVQDDGTILLMLDGQRRIIGLATVAGDEQCDVKSQAAQARGIFPQMVYLPATPGLTEATDTAPRYQISEAPQVRLLLQNNAIALDNGQCGH
ncbi:hypothetical protein [Shewanella sp. YIC-542]|uniref:hypothetical protein n=1 Tax=Shewanella mytili TaxID=3377111 RepID=UPI00398F8326